MSTDIYFHTYFFLVEIVHQSEGIAQEKSNLIPMTYAKHERGITNQGDKKCVFFHTIGSKGANTES